MRTLQILISTLLIAFLSLIAKGQNPMDSVRVTYKNKTVTVKPVADESVNVKFKDSLNNKKIVVKVSYVDDLDNIEKKIEDKIDSNGKKIYDFIKYKKERKHFIETDYLTTLDIGFTGTMNENENAFAINPKMTKSANINIGLVSQNMNLYKDQLLLSYGLHLNNYYFKYSDKQQMQYLDNQGHVSTYKDSNNNYAKNRLDTRYFAIPVLLEYHTKNNNFNIAAGVEFGFHRKTKYMLKGDKNSMEFDQKNETDVKMNDTQISAVLKIGIDDIAIYGKYTLTDMYKDSAYLAGLNPHQHLFSFGVCLFGI